MKKLNLLLGSVFIAYTVINTVASLYNDYQKSKQRKTKNTDELEKRLADCGFQVSTANNGDGSQIIRMRGSYEALQNLANPERINDKPPLPPNLGVASLPTYDCGCPHCGKMSMYGENQWRYQELSRTRGHRDNTTTFLVKCQNCDGFMKCTVDHDD